jgi:hypothetical protein
MCNAHESMKHIYIGTIYKGPIYPTANPNPISIHLIHDKIFHPMSDAAYWLSGSSHIIINFSAYREQEIENQ